MYNHAIHFKQSSYKRFVYHGRITSDIPVNLILRCNLLTDLLKIVRSLRVYPKDQQNYDQIN